MWAIYKLTTFNHYDVILFWIVMPSSLADLFHPNFQLYLLLFRYRFWSSKFNHTNFDHLTFFSFTLNHFCRCLPKRFYNNSILSWISTNIHFWQLCFIVLILPKLTKKLIQKFWGKLDSFNLWSLSSFVLEVKLTNNISAFIIFYFNKIEKLTKTNILIEHFYETFFLKKKKFTSWMWRTFNATYRATYLDGYLKT